VNKARPIPSTALPLTNLVKDRTRAHACDSADLAYFTSDSDVQQLYADTEPVLYASTRVAVTAGSCLIDLHMHCVVDSALESKVATSTMLMLGLVRKWTCSTTPRDSRA
jgi:hypothetical protein